MSTDEIDKQWSLISGHFDGSLNAEERQNLNLLLCTDTAFADQFVQAARLHDKLHLHAKDNNAAIDEIIEISSTSIAMPRLFLAAAAMLLCALGAWLTLGQSAMQEAAVDIEVISGTLSIDGADITETGKVSPKQLIKTGAHSLARLRYTDGSSVELAAQTHIHFTDAQHIHLLQGALTCSIEKETSTQSTSLDPNNYRFLVQTEDAAVHVLGTRFHVEYDNKTDVSVEHGLVAVQTELQEKPIYLKSKDTLSVSKHFLVSSAEQEQTAQTLWSLDFEDGKLDPAFINGSIVAAKDAPSGNHSAFCFQAAPGGQKDPQLLLQAIFKNSEDIWFHAHDDAWISFRYWANRSCGWMGVWMASPPEHHFLHYHREFVPVTDRWVQARIRLSDCVRGQAEDANERMPAGAPVHWFMIQSGKLPGARFFIDDIKIEVPVNK